MALSPNNVGIGMCLFYYAEQGQPMHMPLYVDASSAIQSNAAPQGNHIVFLPPQNAPAVHPQEQNFALPKYPQSNLLPPFGPLVTAAADAGAPFGAIYTPYILQWDHMQQQVCAAFPAPEPNGRGVPMSQISRNICSVNAKDKRQHSLNRETGMMSSGSPTPCAPQLSDSKNSDNGDAEVLCVRGFVCPVGNKNKPGLEMRMDVPPLARRRPPPCRLPPGVLSSAAHSDGSPSRNGGST